MIFVSSQWMFSSGMSVHGSLKDAMVGVELLMANVNEWQKHSASVKEHTSLAQHQAPLAALAARWRNLELSSWSQTMTTSLDKVKSSAYVHWFHLMSVCFPSNGTTPQISAALPLIEQFFQSSSLGQFEARLDLLKLCCQHCTVLVACGQHSFTELATCLQNVHSYYAQHLPAVKQALEGALRNIRKEMKVCTSGPVDPCSCLHPLETC
jgi:midasin (ATPase involved in ribosome maturation)